MIGGPLGAVPLSQVADIAPTDGRYSIRHDGGQRFVSVTFNVSGRSLQNVVSAAKARIARNVVLPAGTYLDFAGAAAAEQKARFEFLLYSAFAFALIVMVLFTSFRWPAHAWLVMANLPFSLIGGILAAWLTGLGLTLGVLVGLVTVFGISARNAILLLAHYEHLVEEEGRSWNLQTVLQGAQERLIPILMTASVTALGLLPLALAIDKPGQEIQGPDGCDRSRRAADLNIAQPCVPAGIGKEIRPQIAAISGNRQRADRGDAGKPRQQRGVAWFDAAQGIDRQRCPTCDEIRARRRQGGMAGMTCRRKDRREKNRVERQAHRFAKRREGMHRRGDQQRRTSRAPVHASPRRASGRCTPSAGSRSSPAISTIRSRLRASAVIAAARAVRRASVARAYNDHAAARQSARRRQRIGQAVVVGEQHQRR